VGSLESASILLQALAHGKKENLMPVIILSTMPTVNNTKAFGIPVFSVDVNCMAICKRYRVECLIVTGGGTDLDLRQLARTSQRHGLDVLLFDYCFLPIGDERPRSMAAGF
jgi:FlaA1/EpsC-like NDP-sugar epimerase